MADLEKPITTQEDLDALLEKDRAEQSKKYDGWLSPEDVSKKYDGFMSPDAVKTQTDALQTQIDSLSAQAQKDSQKYADLDKQFKAEQAKSHGYEVRFLKQKVAVAEGLDIKLADRLSGEKEDDIRKDAKVLKDIMGASRDIPPLKNYDVSEKAKTKQAAWNDVLSGLKGE